MNTEIQTVRCKDCNNIFAANVAPDCYTDKDWLKKLRKYALRGDKIFLETGKITIAGGSCDKNS